MSITHDDVTKITLAVIAALDQQRDITAAQHSSDHRFVQEMAEERRERAQLWRELRVHIAKWGAIGAFTALGVIGWYYVTHALIPQSIGVMPHG